MITAIINARVNSERLKSKHLYKIGDKTIFEHTIDKLLTLKEIKSIYLATGSKKNNYKYEKFLKSKYKNKIRIFYYNNEDDVTKRIYLLSKRIETKYTLLVSGDCPLIDTSFIKRLYNKLSSSENFDFIYSKKNIIHEGIKLFKTNAWSLVKKESQNKIYKENPGFIVKQFPKKFKIVTYKPLKYEILNKKFRVSVDTISDIDFMNYVFFILKIKNLNFEIKNLAKIKDANILNKHVLQRSPFQKKKIINLITIKNPKTGMGHFSRIKALKREVEERFYCETKMILYSNKYLKKNINTLLKSDKNLTIIDLPNYELKKILKKFNSYKKIIVIDNLTNFKKITHIIPNIKIKNKKNLIIYSGMNYLILNREINYINSIYKNLKKNSDRILLLGGSYSIDEEILEFMQKNKNSLKIVIGPLVNKKVIKKLKSQKFKLLVNPSKYFELLKKSSEVYSRFGVSVFELIGLKIKPIVFSKYNYKDNSIINKLEKNKFINIFENRITENKRYININNCYNNISSIINKKL